MAIEGAVVEASESKEFHNGFCEATEGARKANSCTRWVDGSRLACCSLLFE